MRRVNLTELQRSMVADALRDAAVTFEKCERAMNETNQPTFAEQFVRQRMEAMQAADWFADADTVTIDIPDDEDETSRISARLTEEGMS